MLHMQGHERLIQHYSTKLTQVDVPIDNISTSWYNCQSEALKLSGSTWQGGGREDFAAGKALDNATLRPRICPDPSRQRGYTLESEFAPPASSSHPSLMGKPRPVMRLVRAGFPVPQETGHCSKRCTVRVRDLAVAYRRPQFIRGYRSLAQLAATR